MREPYDSMSDPFHKRRRLDDALHKPFRSPMKQRMSESDSQYVPASTNEHECVGTVEDDFGAAHVIPIPHLAASTDVDILDTDLPTTSTSTFSSTALSSPSATLSTAGRPETDSRALEMQIRSLRIEIDTLQQAHRMLTTNRDEELRQLTQKWKAACRPVIEDLFGSANDKINRFGGVRAWREREQSRQQRRKEWEIQDMEEALQLQDSSSESEDEDEEDDEENKLAGSERRERRDRKWEARQARKEMRQLAREEAEPLQDQPSEDGGRGDGNAELEPTNGDSFTIDMMLETLNVDARLVEWDKTEQRWVN